MAILISVNCKIVNDKYNFSGVPNSDSLVGTWSLSKDSVYYLGGATEPRLSKLNLNDNTIVIRSDGTCTFTTYRAFQSNDDYLISNGTWRIKYLYSAYFSAEMWAVEFSLEPKPSEYVETTLFLSNGNGDLRLFTFVGDPDKDNIVEFEKQK